MATWLKRSLLVSAAACCVAGCKQRVPYGDLGRWDSDVKVPGPVEACQGGWCCLNGQCQWPWALTVALCTLLLLSACTTQLAYRGYGTWDQSVKVLGPVEVCRGAFCQSSDEGAQFALALMMPPEAETYHAALRAKAATVYHVPEEQIVLSEVQVHVVSEMVGTVRGWRAIAQAGQKPPPPPPAAVAPAAPSIADRLEALRALHVRGLVSDTEYNARREKILDGL